MPDAAASTPRPRQSAVDVTEGDRQDDDAGRTGRVQQQVDPGANDTGGLRWAEGVGLEPQPARTFTFT